MPDLLTATQDAVFDALNVPEVTAIAPVFQHVPDDQQPPVVIIADITAESIGGKDGGLDRITVEILTLMRQPDRLPLYSLMAAVRTALDGPIAAEGALLSHPVHESSDDTLLDDAQTYMGTQRFSLIAQPA